MSAFSSFYDNSASLLNSPATLNDIFALLDEPNTDHFQQFYQPESSSFQNLDHSTNVDSALTTNNINDPFVFTVTNKNAMDSESIVTGYKYDDDDGDDDEKTTQMVITPMDKKRKLKQGPSANSAQSKDMREMRRKKQQKMKDGEMKKATDQEAPSPREYVHVRARRGQATNSHSLAERVRREKISKRMKLLQALVPGCDKLTGKALVLDEIINYVQSLQNQVEFLSMKIASATQMYNDFGMESDEYMTLSNLGSPLQAMEQINITRTANDYYFMDNTTNSTLFQSSQIPNHLPSGNRHVAWIEEDQRQML